MTGRQIDDEPLDLALSASLQLGRYHLDVRTTEERRLWVEFIERSLDEAREVAPQENTVFFR
jgi:hypothetical protein